MGNLNIEESERLTLDTHILLWYLEGIKLESDQIQIIEKFRINNNLYISAISFWEIAMLHNKGKVVFSIPLTEWINKVLSIEGLKLIELSTNILIESCNLPKFEHKDPADRMIIASSRSLNSYLMTMDQRIINYSKKGYLKIV
jgi:PIN domain nuclease of toxin-antitoxin system